MSKMMIIHSERCVGCDLCWQACSIKKENVFNPAKARIAITRWYPKEISFQMICEHCEAPLCRDSCPSNAIYREEATGIVRVDPDLCTGCKICIIACPVGAISLHPLSGASLKCDMCDGKPQCVVVCPTDAITFEDETPASRKVKKDLVMHNFERRAKVDAIMLTSGSKADMMKAVAHKKGGSA